MTNPTINSDGTKCWRDDRGQLHRTDGPAVEHVTGNKFWYENGLRHRTDGPAIEYAYGTNYWYQLGLLHRLDGPALEYKNGDMCWFRWGRELTEEDHQLLTFVNS